jgi:DNA-binding NtrC family response regulator
MNQEATLLVIHSSPEPARRVRESLASLRDQKFRSATVLSAGSLAEALNELNSCVPTLIFLGMELGDSAGLGTLRTIRSKCPLVPIIVMVDDDDHVTGAATLGNGAQDYLFLSEDRPDVIERAMVRAVERRRVEERHAESGWRSGIGETALGLRHEINNPLASLMLNLEMLKEGGHEDAGELLEGIEIAAKRIAAVVRRLERLHTPQRVPAIGGEAMVDLSGKDKIPGSTERTSGGDSPGPSKAGSTILLVDDEESVRAIVTKILGRYDHTVLEAEHGADALRLAAGYDGRIDLLITDMYMPGLRGPEIYEKLKATRPDLRVLFISGYGDEDVARSGVEPGTAFLKKPFTVQDLSEAVKLALRKPTAR